MCIEIQFFVGYNLSCPTERIKQIKNTFFIISYFTINNVWKLLKLRREFVIVIGLVGLAGLEPATSTLSV